MSFNYNSVEWYQEGNCGTNCDYGSMKSYGQILYMDPHDGPLTLGQGQIISPTPIEEIPCIYSTLGKPHAFKTVVKKSSMVNSGILKKSGMVKSGMVKSDTVTNFNSYTPKCIYAKPKNF